MYESWAWLWKLLNTNIEPFILVGARRHSHISGQKPIGVWLVDDGTGVLECVQRTPAIQHIPEPGTPLPITPQYPPPSANVGDCVCVVGRARKKGEFWQLAIDSIGEHFRVLKKIVSAN